MYLSTHQIVRDIMRRLRPDLAPAMAKDFEAPKPKPVIEERREWAHSDSEGKGKDCNRYNKPVHTEPNKIPGTCRDWQCDSKEWVSKGLITRDKSTRKILTRDGKKVD